MITPAELEDAVRLAMRCRLVEGWAGNIRVEYDRKHRGLVIAQCATAARRKGRKIIFNVPPGADWADYFDDESVHGNFQKLRLDAQCWHSEDFDVLKNAEVDDGEYVIRGEQIAEFFDELDWDGILGELFEQAEERLYEAENVIS